MKLVSIVSPCYNGERYIERYLKSILAQTYRPLELVLINDGSQDQTEDIIFSYKATLKKENIILKYIKKANEGLGAAINDGLKYVSGEYLIWPDTDDFLYPASIEKRVKFLEDHQEYGFVYSDGCIYSENDIEKPVRKIRAHIPKNGELFINVISGNVVYTPCGYMLRMSAFRNVNPNMEIFPSRYGQDIQMLLPISYKFKCGYLQEELYGRVDRSDSLSKSVWIESDDAWKKRVLGLEEIYIATLKSIGGEALAYIPYIQYRDLRILLAISKKIGKSVYIEQRRTLMLSLRLMLGEICKTLVNLIKR